MPSFTQRGEALEKGRHKWHIRSPTADSAEGKYGDVSLSLDFYPLGEQRGEMHLILVDGDLNHMFGVYNGTITLNSVSTYMLT